jgi:hypothetical protein
MRSLRANLIRLAYEHPELREEILPLVKEAGIGHATDTLRNDIQYMMRSTQRQEHEGSSAITTAVRNAKSAGVPKKEALDAVKRAFAAIREQTERYEKFAVSEVNDLIKA